MRNEEANLTDCVGPIVGLMHEIIVVDTGSTDRSREIAQGFGRRIVEFPWIDDFSAARNEGLRLATGNWIFWMDADDRLDTVNLERFKRLILNLADENACYVMQCLCARPAMTRRLTWSNICGCFEITRRCAGNIGFTNSFCRPL